VRLSRRDFMKLAGASVVVGVPGVAGYRLFDAAQGELPPRMSPYATLEEFRWIEGGVDGSAPLLLLLNDRSGNPFGAYLGEILLCQGLHCFRTAYTSALDQIPLELFGTVLLAEGPLDADQAERLRSFVLHGGSLLAMRPDPLLADVLGVAPTGGTLAEGYLAVNPNEPATHGICRQTMQFHGTADHYRPAGARPVAWLADDRDTITEWPAITLHRYGEGHAAMWAYDLARSTAYMRQGNPEWANQERDGIDLVRATDQMVGWMDLDRIEIPQADEQARLLVRVLDALSVTGCPLPRIGCLPPGANGILLATSDSHSNPTSAIEDILREVESFGGHMSVYYSPLLHPTWRRAGTLARYRAATLPVADQVIADRYTSPSDTQVRNWRERGHEFGLHPFVDLDPNVPKGLEAGWTRYWQEFTGLGYGPVPPTVRTHAILWTGWVETARYQASVGMRLNLDYYHVGPAFRAESGEWRFGHATGSSLPMRFVDEQGRILAVYQQLTQLADEHLIELHWGGHAKLPVEEALEITRALLDQATSKYPGAVTGNYHVDPFVSEPWRSTAGRLLAGTLAEAAARGMPIWTASRWLHFTEARRRCAIHEVQWDADWHQVRFEFDSSSANEELMLLIPQQHGDGRLEYVTVDGRERRHQVETGPLKGLASLRLEPGRYEVVARYGVA